jgi:2-polyprenyl-3-methyl-5-hydroxy-6-metoxy-1,4-benzoquinol methylase
MSLLPALRQRDRQPELMDQPGLEQDRHEQALKSLARINWISRSSAIIWPAIRSLARTAAARPIRVLDVACGGGDVVLAIRQQAEKAQLPIEVAGCDISETAINFANARAADSRANVNFFQADAIGAALPDEFDVVMCSLFLHHLDEDDAIKLLTGMGRAARRVVLVNDLRRTRLGYLMAYVGVRLLSRSKIVHTDGPLSVRAAFSMAEVKSMADAAELDGATISRHWPERFLLAWKREP